MGSRWSPTPATARLSGGAARYAWAVVIIAAGLSGESRRRCSWPGRRRCRSAPAVEGGSGAAGSEVGAYWPAIAAAVSSATTCSTCSPPTITPPHRHAQLHGRPRRAPVVWCRPWRRGATQS
ncbi:hypothetical protein HBB16_00015 [Pseudonocardia sp. MCCB 268]|nr:hypothetical protein [Pseudonocardia cytotoxica]